MTQFAKVQLHGYLQKFATSSVRQKSFFCDFFISHVSRILFTELGQQEYLLIEKLCEGALCVYLLEIISKKLSLLRHAKKEKNFRL